MFENIFVVGTWTFYVLVLSVFLLTPILLNIKRYDVSAGYIIGALLTLSVANDITMEQFTAIRVIGFGLLYLAMGVGWSGFAWFSFCLQIKNKMSKMNRDLKSKLTEEEKTFFEKHNLSIPKKFNVSKEDSTNLTSRERFVRDTVENTISLEMRTLAEKANGKHNMGRLDFVPRPEANVERLAMWIAFWPIDLVRTFVLDFLLYSVEHMFKVAFGYYWRAARNVFKDVID